MGYALKVAGTIQINPPAAKALKSSASLLAVGIESVVGNFTKGDLVVIVSQAQNSTNCIDSKSNQPINQSINQPTNQLIEIARGISNYSADEVRQIQGMNTEKIQQIFGFSETEVVHRDNMLISND